jgi:hypothetical protein
MKVESITFLSDLKDVKDIFDSITWMCPSI